MDATITSENMFRNSGIDAIIFNYGPLKIYASLILEDFFGRSRILPLRFKLSFIVVFFRIVSKKKFYRRSSVKYRTFSEGPT